MNKPERWKEDVRLSVDMYNEWFMREAPQTFIESRVGAAKHVIWALEKTDYLRNIEPILLKSYPDVLSMLRMATAPPIARDRLAGLANVPTGLIKVMEEEKRLYLERDEKQSLEQDSRLRRIGNIIELMADRGVFPWLEHKGEPSSIAVERASAILADRLTGALTNPILRNAQENRQMFAIRRWLESHGYKYVDRTAVSSGAQYSPQLFAQSLQTMSRGSFTHLLNVPVSVGKRQYNIAVDVVVKSLNGPEVSLPVMIEAKSAGDFTNPNKRRKEEATKRGQLARSYGEEIKFVLFLCGYFDVSYLGYEASENIDWVWEHRPEDFTEIGL